MKILSDKLFDQTFEGIHKSLELTWRRNEAINSNIANAETPKYRAVDLNFADELERAFNNKSGTMLRTDSKHMDVSSSELAHLSPDYSGVTKPDGNNVDIDIQMGRLAYNSSKYSMGTSLLRKKFQTLMTAIRQSA